MTTFNQMFVNHSVLMTSLKTEHAHLSVVLSQSVSEAHSAVLVKRIAHNLSEQDRYENMFNR
jgi:hypothetical protein